MTIIPTPIVTSAALFTCAIKAPDSATKPLDKPSPKIIRRSVFAEKLRIMRWLSPVARIASPTSVFKNQSTNTLIKIIIISPTNNTLHVFGTFSKPRPINALVIAASIPKLPHHVATVEKIVSTFNNGIFGRPTEFSSVKPIMRKLIEYSAIIIKIPDSKGLILPFVCSRPVIQPATKPASIATSVAITGL